MLCFIHYRIHIPEAVQSGQIAEHRFLRHEQNALFVQAPVIKAPFSTALGLTALIQKTTDPTLHLNHIEPLSYSEHKMRGGSEKGVRHRPESQTT